MISERLSIVWTSVPGSQHITPRSDEHITHMLRAIHSRHLAMLSEAVAEMNAHTGHQRAFWRPLVRRRLEQTRTARTRLIWVGITP